MTDLRAQCDAFAKDTSGCGECTGSAFDVSCDSTFGPVKVDFASVLDPCNDNIQLNLTAEAFGVEPVNIEFKYVPGSDLTTSNTFNEEVTPGVKVGLDIDTTVRNPKANTLAAQASVNVCLTLDKSKLPEDVKSLVDGAVGLACLVSPSGTLCGLASGRKLCGSDLSSLLSSPLVKGAIESALSAQLGTDFTIPDFTLPISLPEQSVEYSCEGGVTKILQGSTAVIAAPLMVMQTALAAVTFMTALFRL